MGRAGAAPKVVLVADDDKSMCKVLERRLISWGYGVLLAGDGVEAVRLARERRPDVILLDVMMPGLDGLSACRQLKAAEETRAIPIILVTAKSSQLSGDQVKEVGAVGNIPKPYEPAELLRVIQRALGQGQRGGA